MKLTNLAIVYAAVAVGWLAFAWLKRDDVKSSLGESLLLALLWPLYAPFWLTRLRGPEFPAAGNDPREQTLLRTLRRAKGTLLEAVLPDADTARHVAARLRVAEQKLREIDGLLAQPAFSEPAAIARRDQLIERGASFFAIQAADKRIQSIQKLRQLRKRFRNEIEEVDELIQQLAAQTEVLRIAREQDPQVQAWTNEIMIRIEALDAAMSLDDSNDDLPEQQPDRRVEQAALNSP